MEFSEQIPKSKPDIKIGPLSIWILGVIHEDETPDWIVFKTPMLLETSNIVVFSPKSDIKLFELRNLVNDLKEMLDNIGSEEKMTEAPLEESEFGLKLESNLQGHVGVSILYRAWINDGQLEFEDKIDQSYLPPIISKLESILKEHTKT